MSNSVSTKRHSCACKLSSDFVAIRDPKYKQGPGIEPGGERYWGNSRISSMTALNGAVKCIASGGTRRNEGIRLSIGASDSPGASVSATETFSTSSRKNITKNKSPLAEYLEI